MEKIDSWTMVCVVFIVFSIIVIGMFIYNSYKINKIISSMSNEVYYMYHFGNDMKDLNIYF